MNIPSATYRIQFNAGFTFRHLNDIIDYLADMGVSTIYASPVFKAVPGSMHGYDVTDPHQVNPEIGTYEEWRALAARLKEKNMNWLQDIVPNHMAFSLENERLFDVLERGLQSSYSHYFDIDWEHPDPALRHKIIVPTLGNDTASCIDDGTIQLAFIPGKGLALQVYDKAFPVNPALYASILARFTAAPSPAIDTQGPLETWKQRKQSWLQELDPFFAAADARAFETVNQDKEFLRHIVASQHYHLCKWDVSDHLMNYRRFFTVNELICLRMEDQRVFDDYHVFIRALYAEGLIQGVRIDHIDGLQDPEQYVQRLRALLGEECYIICEKILERKEQLPPHWQLQGTSGYEFLSYTNQVLTSRAGGEALLRYYRRAVADEAYESLVYRNKLRFLKQYMRGEWDNLFRLLQNSQLVEGLQPSHKEALAVFMAAFPVYRIYISKLPVNGSAAGQVQEAFETAKAMAPGLLTELETLRQLFYTRENSAAETFLKRMMQFTGPLAAKGVEDTSFYVYHPLVSHNEVGDSPCELGMTVQQFHEKMGERQSFNPYSLNNTATHDTKRGEDARMRLNALAAYPQKWIAAVEQWKQLNQTYKPAKGPDANDEYFLYQCIVGALPPGLDASPDFLERLKAYMQKALREAKVHSNWSQPNTGYEEACALFIDKIFRPEHPFGRDLAHFVKGLLPLAGTYSLAQLLLKSTAPGIPDFYQGTELWDLSFVDPDNRRPVDYEDRRRLLQQCLGLQHDWNALHLYLVQNAGQGALKFWLTRQLMQVRRALPDLFTAGEYIPLLTRAPEQAHLCYARRLDETWLLAALPLQEADPARCWHNAALDLPGEAPRQWRNIFSNRLFTCDEPLALEALAEGLPVLCLLSA